MPISQSKKEYNARYYQKHKEEIKIQRKSWNSANQEKRLSYCRNFNRRNRLKRSIDNRRYRQKRADELREYRSEWSKRNSDLVCFYSATRKANQLLATPKWANEFFIKEAYALASLRSKVMTSKWHVDHIVPLKSDLVCGLHVENNLRVIPQPENNRKKNLWWPDMPS